MIVGLALGFVDAFTDVELTSDLILILLVFLPPPLFEGAINLDLEDLVSRPPDDR